MVDDPYTGPIVTRAEARARGLPRYFTSKPCKRGHLMERFTSSLTCMGCAHAVQQANYKINRQHVLDKGREWRIANAESRSSSDRRYRLANAEKIKIGKRRCYDAKPDHYTALRKAYYLAHPQKAREAADRWAAANPDKRSAARQRRRARILGADGAHAATDIADIRRLQKDRCAICRIPLRKHGAVDHIQALARGGTNDRRNLQLLCMSCNNRKHAKDPIIFAQECGLLI